MERCTIRLKTGEARCAQLDGDVVAERLAAYEDTGLMPEEIAAHRWIPVTEQLPENDARVLAFCKDRVIHDMKWSWVQVGWLDKVTGGIYFKDFVTHWMPLPEAPKVE